MKPDTTSIPGYTIFRDEPGDAAPDLSDPRPFHPLDQLSLQEIRVAADLIRRHADPKRLKFNCLSLREPPKAEYQAFRAGRGPRPPRRAFAVVLIRGTSDVAEVLVDLDRRCVEFWEDVHDVGPMLTLEDLDACERVARADPRFHAACRGVGIVDMDRVFVDGWAIGFDHRWGLDRRLQQGLVYYRASPGDNQYAHPLDFSVVVDTEKEEVLAIDIRYVNGERTPPQLAEHNYTPAFLSPHYRHDRLKPIAITQPEGVSFSLKGNELFWAGFQMHLGFNYREGLVISDLAKYDDHEGRLRTLFDRISVVEMVVPYGHPDPPHHKKHAFDVGEYGAGLMANSLKLGCDCKGAVHYLDAIMAVSTGEPALIKNAVCIHEEDAGLLYKHTDYRDGSVVAVRDRRLVISQIITAANYDYAFYHSLTLDGTYRLEVRLTGMLSTYCLHPSETAEPYGTRVAPAVTAHNHQHIFSLRVDPAVDGPANVVVQNDVELAPDDDLVNPHGNGFRARRIPLRPGAAADYCHETSRSWDITNPAVRNPRSGAPVAYRILNPSSPRLLALPRSVLWRRAAFARHALWVLPHRDWRIFPAGDYVCQSTGAPGHPHNPTVLDWAAEAAAAAESTSEVQPSDVVCYIQFGLNHFPRTEDFPIMPAEPVAVTLRATGFFATNPALWVPPTAAADEGSCPAFPGRHREDAECSPA